MPEFNFPEGFIWGAATASYQIEGAYQADGRGMTIWDTFCRTPGKVLNGDTGDVACDHYHLYQDDIQMMADLGLKGYRFSIAWARILPQGLGSVNEAGLDFYDRVVDTLLEKSITPFATLYHWDLPQILQNAGGWPARATVEAFVNYADIVTSRLGDRVKNWMTFNEPWVVAFLGHALGIHAPGDEDWEAALATAHNLLLAHGRAVPVIRQNVGDGAQVGIVLNLTWADPATTSEADIAAAKRMDGYQNRWFLDPVLKGSYPEDMVKLYGGVPGMQDGDLDEIHVPLDYLGINYYNRAVVKNGETTGPIKVGFVLPEGEYTEMEWEVHPESFYKVLKRVHDDYAPPAMYITENGAAYDDHVSPDGAVHDPKRQAFLAGHFASAHRAISEGVPLKGYFVWSLMDNFEWALGYSKRFGITYVNYETQERIVKDSGQWYSQVIGNNGFAMD